MQTPSRHLWRLRIATFSVAALAAASATYWALKWTGAAPATPTAALAFSDANPTDPQAVARLLGGAQSGVAAAPEAPLDKAASRFKLTGVVTDRASGGYALIAIDGKPAQPYRVGAQVDDAWLLKSIAPRSAALAASLAAPTSLTLDMPTVTPP
jgi:general secretion pathway protein C